MSEENKEKARPTKKWIEEQINYHLKNVFSNQGSIDLLQAMLKNGVYVEEEEKKDA